MRLLLAYLHRQRGWIALYILVAVIFTVVFFLEDVESVALTYALLLCTVVLLLTGTVDFLRFSRRHRYLQRLLRRELTTAEKFPEAADYIEEDYQQLLSETLRSKVLALDRRDIEAQERRDYYTMWVHQIKTPISAMSLILQEEDTDRNRELEAQLFRIRQYVDMVLAYLRMGSDTSDYVLAPCRLDEAVRQSVRKFAPLLIRSRIHLELGNLDATVITDEKWLCFCLEQLLANTVQYAPRGTVRIQFSNRMLTVSDTGIGIAPEDLPRIFEKGYTGLNGRREKKATGIGLYLCKRILTKLGHRLTITSQVGEGTTAAITFPQERETWE